MADKPSFPKRLETFLSALEHGTLISVLEQAYEETRNENVFVALQFLKAKIHDARENEMKYIQSDIDEVIAKPGLFPASVVMWIMHYRDQEMS